MDFDMEIDFDYEYHEKNARKYCFNKLLVERVFKLYHELNNPEKNNVFCILFYLDILWYPPFSPELEKFEKIVSTLENFREAGQLDQVMDVLCFFVVRQKKLYKKMLSAQGKANTQDAHQAKKQKMIAMIIDLESYLRDVEFVWHPSSQEESQDSSRMMRNSQTNASTAIKKVYRENSEKINVVLEKYGVKKDFLKAFSNCFRYYTDAYRKWNDGRTVSGYKLETRAPRNSDSRKKSSDAAKRSWKNRKK